MQSKASRRILSLLLCFCMVLGMVPGMGQFAEAAGNAVNGVNGYGDVKVIKATNHTIAPGVTETDVILNDSTGDAQVMGYLTTIDLTQGVTIKASYSGFYNGTDSSKWGVSGWNLEKTTNQAAAYEASTGENVVVATNGDYFNMQTGQPSGPLVMNGVNSNPDKSAAEPYFAILKDGTAVLRDAGTSLDDVQEAIGGPFFLIRNGQIAIGQDYDLMPRNSIGLKADGTVVTFLADGRQYPASVGMSLYDQAQFLLAQGVVECLYLDGGGSATYATEREGSGTLTIQNSPSDGTERSVSSALLIVSTAKPSGVFDHAAITPNDEAYTPGSVVEFTAQGIDSSGASAELPSGLVWTLAAGSEGMGTIDAATGVFTSNGTQGSVTVNTTLDGEIVGSTTILIVEPDSIYFNSERISLDFGESSDLGFVVRADGRDVIFRDDDFTWTITSNTEGVDDSAIGAMNGNIFVAGKSDATLAATIKVSYARTDSTVLEATVGVEIGKMPIVLFDFEADADGNPMTGAHYHWGSNKFHSAENTEGMNGYVGNVPSVDAYTSGTYTDSPVITTLTAPYIFTDNWDSAVPASDIFKANGYDFYLWPNGTITTYDVGRVNFPTEEQGGQIRFGDHSMELNYDYASYDGSANANFYIRYSGEPVYIEGTPKQIGCWVYADATSAGYVLYGQLAVWDGSDYVTKFWPLTYGEGDPGYIDFTGWKYMYADVSSAAAYISEEHPAAIIPGNGLLWLSYQPGKGRGGRYAGTLYFDNFRVVYGTDMDDLDNPEIESVSVNGIALSEDEIVQITDNALEIVAVYDDVDGANRSGVDATKTTVLIDGQAVVSDNSDTQATTRLELANGQHSVQVTAYDAFGNYSTMTCYFVVNNVAGQLNGATLSGDTTVTMGNDYILEVNTQGSVDSVDMTVVQVNSDFGAPTVTFEDGWTGNVEYTETGFKKAKMTISAEYTGEGTAPADALVAKLAFNVPTDVDPEIDFFTYQVSEISCVTTAGATVTSAQPMVKLTVSAYYTVISEPSISGNSTVLTVKNPGGDVEADVEVYVNDALVGTTDANGQVTTDVSVNLTAGSTFTARAQKGSNLVSFSTTITVLAAAGDVTGLPVAIALPATSNAETTQNITWLANANGADHKAVVQYVKADEYNNGECTYTTVEGVSTLTAFNTDKTAALVNAVQITGLEADTTYCFRVGDGQDGHWSAVQEFKTAHSEYETTFFVVGDTQMSSNVTEDTEEIALLEQLGALAAGSDFGIQTGDYVDNAGNFAMWDEIRTVFNTSFAGMDIVQTMGNHEYYGDFSGDTAEALFAMSNQDYYSVEYGSVYVASISFDADLDEALEWLVKDAKASDAIWKVLTVHQPAYYTNPNGGNDIFHAKVPAAVDEAGINVVFSGHDHSYARTERMTANELDATSGAVYFICGDLGEKSRNINYAAVNNPDFNFAFLSQEYDALVLVVEANYDTMTVTAKDADGTVIDTCVIEHPNQCRHGHSFDEYYDSKTGEMVCSVCREARISATEYGTSGLVRDLDTDCLMYFINGVYRTGHQYYLSKHYYFEDNGLGYEGEYTLCGETTLFDDGRFVSCSTAEVINAGKAGENVEFVLYADGTLVLEGTGKMEAFSNYSTVPWYLDRAQILKVKFGADITNVADTSFYEHLNLKTVEFEAGSKLTSIDGAAFYHCAALTDVVLPDNVATIYGNAFAKCFGLKSLYLPDGVIYISSRAFTYSEDVVLSVAYKGFARNFAKQYDIDHVVRYPEVHESGTCGENLTWTLDNGVLNISGTGAMTNFASGAAVPWSAYRETILEVNIAAGVTTVGDMAFYGCTDLKTVNFADGSEMTVIGGSAFNGCSSLKEVILPETVTRINGNAFANAPALSYVYMPEALSFVSNAAFKNSSEVILNVALNSYAANYAFVNNIDYIERMPSVLATGTCGDKLTWELSGNGVLTISGTGAMANFASGNEVPWYNYRDLITEVHIASGVTTLGDMAFYKCTALKTVEFGENSQLTVIGGSAFSGCTSLITMTLPSNVTTIYGNAFANTAALQSVYMPNGVSFISSQAFRNNKNVVLSVGEDSYAKEFAEKNNIKYVERKPVVVASGTCGEALTWELASDNVLTISGTGAMTNYAASKDVPWYAYRDVIAEVEIESGVTTLGDMAFYKCTALTKVTFEEDSKLKIVGGSAFNGCASLEEVVLPEGVTTVYGNAFAKAPALTSVYLPDTVKFISVLAFKGSSNVVLDVEPASYAKEFAEDNNIKYVERTPVEVASGTCGEALTWVLTSDNVLTISGTGAMSNYAASKDVPWYAYRSEIQEVNIAAGVTTLGDMAFYKFASLETVNFEDGSKLTVVGGSAFNGCASLVTVELPASVTTIYGNAFANCPALTTVKIPSTVAFVSSLAFKNSPNVKVSVL